MDGNSLVKAALRDSSNIIDVAIMNERLVEKKLTRGVDGNIPNVDI